ncbi:MAG TPA: DUF2752 domain-containing protein [Bacteroidota bacterium]|nr:DUF2752 domain-containing protein [Bacteroidota bacterium]
MPRNRLYTYLLFFTLSGWLWLGWNVADQSVHGETPTVCLFKAITGLPCPSCGATRAILLLLHGNFRDSMMMNPLGIILLLGLIILLLWLIADMLRRSDSFYRSYRKTENMLAHNYRLSVPLVFLVLSNWIWNIVKGL